jgi:hypothetical protein
MHDYHYHHPHSHPLLIANAETGPRNRLSNEVRGPSKLHFTSLASPVYRAAPLIGYHLRYRWGKRLYLRGKSSKDDHIQSHCLRSTGEARETIKISIKRPAALAVAVICSAFSSCSTPYQPNSFAGGYSDFLVAPDEAIVTFRGNGYTPIQKLLEMAALRCAEVTLAHGYRYFVATGMGDLSTQSTIVTPGVSRTYAYANGFGNFVNGSATTYETPPMAYNITKPGIQVAIKMSNNQKALVPFGAIIGTQRIVPRDAVFIKSSLRQNLNLPN